MSGDRTSTSDDELLLRLTVVSQELAVADDELAAQQRQIDDLVARELDARHTVSAIARSVPVPVVVTDAAGSVVEANQAAGTLFGIAVGRLSRKPVQAFVHPDGRGAARDLVSRAATTGHAEGVLVLTPRTGPVREVRVVLTAGGRHPDGRTSLTWVFATQPGAGTPDERAADAAALRAVSGLTALGIGDRSLHDLLTRIAVLATTAVVGASWTSVVLGDPADPDELAADSEQAQRMDGAQWRTRQGPSVDARGGDAPVVAHDLTSDPRWPDLAALAGELPAASAVAVPIRGQDGARGVLTVYGRDADVFGADVQVDRALVFAEAAAAVLHDLQRIDELRSTAENLKVAMSSRATIEQTKGLIAGWLQCSVEEAFAALSRLSMDRNVKLRDLAALAVADPSRHDLQPLLVEALGRVRRESPARGR
ncbi:ANTAR domain-containing protein [Kineococcus rhizosphaerae]|uniref:PAS domain S-box-containing protein n=1 Tax=Kineococcus rhizosphaerae TaxID=559628 RepID=A0A2T0R3F1_9ACTN|nr:ANTAR domain-containing protein [Kineococcus rhizosphaerae]PRY14540.1 PAS domain S-box-containing protein [Kineococcus rhizosphaerae]